MARSIPEQQVYELLGVELDKCVAIHARRGVESLEVQPGSRMHDDDARLDPFQISHAVKGALASSLDHIHAVRGLLLANQLNMAAPFTLMRAALENAALALWLIEPDEQSERFTRKLQIEMDDAYDAGIALALTTQPGRTYQERQADVLDVAARVGVDSAKLTGKRARLAIEGPSGQRRVQGACRCPRVHLALDERLHAQPALGASRDGGPRSGAGEPRRCRHVRAHRVYACTDPRGGARLEGRSGRSLD
ncbi:MAG: hypothetical protein NVS3B18_09500 [Candidatus Dormibacteria bacterium]